MKTAEDFIFSLNYLMLEYNDKLPLEYLNKNNLNDISEINFIIVNAIEGKKEDGLYRLKNVRDYLIDCLQYYKNVYGFDNEFESQEEIEFVLSELILDLEPNNFTKIAQIITPQEIIDIKGLSRKKGLPEDVEREILSFVGKTPVGGYRKKGTKQKCKRKNKTKYKKSNAKTSKKIKKYNK